MGNNIKGKQGFQGMTHEEFIQKASQNNDKLNITLNSNINDKNLNKEFLKQLRTSLKKIEVISNNE